MTDSSMRVCACSVVLDFDCCACVTCLVIDDVCMCACVIVCMCVCVIVCVSDCVHVCCSQLFSNRTCCDVCK